MRAKHNIAARWGSVSSLSSLRPRATVWARTLDRCAGSCRACGPHGTARTPTGAVAWAHEHLVPAIAWLGSLAPLAVAPSGYAHRVAFGMVGGPRALLAVVGRRAFPCRFAAGAPRLGSGWRVGVLCFVCRVCARLGPFGSQCGVRLRPPLGMWGCSFALGVSCAHACACARGGVGFSSGCGGDRHCGRCFFAALRVVIWKSAHVLRMCCMCSACVVDVPCMCYACATSVLHR